MNNENTVATTTNTEVEEKEYKLPMPVYLKTKSGAGIVSVATSETEYVRYYYSAAQVNANALTKPHREKRVTLPVSVDGETFRKVHKLFNYLCENKGYVRTKVQ